MNIKCDYCPATVETRSREAREWDWFKGCLDRTQRFCPRCKNERRLERANLFAKSRQKPGKIILPGKA